MAIATLQSIINKIRKLSSSPDSIQLSDSDIVDYINSFYLYDFPAEFRAWDLKDMYTFNTIKGIDTYPFDKDHWTTLENPSYVAKRQVQLYYDVTNFYFFQFNSSNHWQTVDTIDYGDGTIGPYSGTLQKSPIIRSINNNPIASTQTSNTASFPSGFPPVFPGSNISRIQNLLITASNANGSTQNATDDGAGNIIGDASGTIDYDTGVVSNLIFNSAVSDGIEIKALYSPVVLRQPLAILFFQNQLVVRPVPDMGYTVEITGYRLPSSLLLQTTSETSFGLDGRPETQEWWETIAVGASKKIYEDRLDMDGVQMMDKMLQERYNANYTRTYANMSKRRAITIYADQYDFTNGSNNFGVGNF